MSAAQFLNTTTVSYIRPNTDVLRPKAYNVIKHPEATESHKLNHQMMAFVSREIADTLEYLAEQKLISFTGVDYFKNKANGDIDYLEGLYRKNNKMDAFTADFNRVIGLFRNFTKLSTSEFQRAEDPMLEDILTTIFSIAFIQNNVTFLSWCIGRKPDVSVQKMITKKRNELETLFMSRFSKVSNQKNFDFNRFNHLFTEFQTITYAEFNKLTEDIGKGG